MDYVIMNRIDAHRATYVKEAPNTAIISITDIAAESNKFYTQTWLKAVLDVKFDDVDAGHYGCITVKQADEIAMFSKCVYKQVERIIVHCEFGQSRSAGVAAAIRQCFEGNTGDIFESPAYCPNMTCYRYVLNSLTKKSKWEIIKDFMKIWGIK